MISSKSSLLVAAAVLAFTSSSYAAVITPGGAIPAAPVTTYGSASVLGDNNFLTFVGTDASSNLVFSGGEASEVISNDSNNPLGGLTFLYYFNNGPTSPDAIDRVTISGFAGFSTDVGFLSGTGNFDPVVVTRSSNGDVIGFDFSALGFPNNDVTPGSASDFLVIRTDATKDQAATMSLEDGGNGTVATFAPATGSGRTPEPASLSLLALGGLALATRRRK